jgi:hypothetical protein
VVLIFADDLQGLVPSEAVARVGKISAPAIGRPACAPLPPALNAGNAVLSLGCCVARAYLDALDDRVSMWALPGIKIESYCAEISALARANQVLTSFHKRRRKDVEAGEHPTVRKSLERFSSEVIRQNPHERG